MDLCQTASSAVSESPAKLAFLESVLTDWLGRPGITVACGQWADGAISEIVPEGLAEILPARYEGCFAGVRELRIKGAPHHIHLDLGRVHRVAYAIAPSVCLGFKPSMELRLLISDSDGRPTDRWLVSVMLSSPYVRQSLDTDAVAYFLRQARQHARQRPDLVELSVDPAARTGVLADTLLAQLRLATGLRDGSWDHVVASMNATAPASAQRDEPLCLDILRHALALKDASLVIFRDRTLVEFKTERLDAVHRYEEHGHVSWQIGGFHDHHCHLALDSVYRVEFSAEPVSCQDGGVNYSLWFLTRQPAGNPYRRDGYFSIVLNRPYTGPHARREVIDPVLHLYRRFKPFDWVGADALFLDIERNGPPARDGTRSPTLPRLAEVPA